MGGDSLVSFFHKVQSVEESFLLLDPDQRGRAINILQSSLNKLLNFAGDNSVISVSTNAHINNTNATQLLEKPMEKKIQGSSGNGANACSKVPLSRRHHSAEQKKSVKMAKRRVGLGEKRGSNICSTNTIIVGDNAETSAFNDHDHFEGSHVQRDRSQNVSLTRQGFGSKENFEDELQELASFDCSYDFGHSMVHRENSSVSSPSTAAAAVSVAHGVCKYSEPVLTMRDTSNENACSNAHSQFVEQVIDTSLSAPPNHGEASCSVSNAEYENAMLSSSSTPSIIKSSCSVPHTQYTSAIVSTPLLDVAGNPSQYAVAVVDMSGMQNIQACESSNMNSNPQYTSAMLVSSQGMSNSSNSQLHYTGALLSMSMPDNLRYSPMYYGSRGLLSGSHNDVSHLQFATNIPPSSRQCEGQFSFPHSHIPGTVFDLSASGPQTNCNAFQYRGTFLDGSAQVGFENRRQLHQVIPTAGLQPVMGKWWLFQCKRCGQSFTHPHSVKAHLLSHGISRMSCRICRTILVNEVALAHHICGGPRWKQASRLSKEILTCPECNKTFTSTHKLRCHLVTEHDQQMSGDIKFTCRFCGMQFDRKLSLFVHYRHHAGGRFVCLSCGAVLNDVVQYAWHLSHHNKRRQKMASQRPLSQSELSSDLPYDLCVKTYSTKLSVKKKKGRIVKVKVKVKGSKLLNGNKDHTCNICHKQFTRANQLQLHVRLHTGEKPVPCEVCNISFRTPKALAKHRQTLAHCQRVGKMRERQYLCSECGKSYFRHHALQRHLRHHQKSSKLFSCQYCNFRCREHDNLRRHTARHFSTQRNFICEQCGAAFHAKKTLEMHYSYKHSSERQFKCPDCPMTFKAHNALSRHAKIHSSVRDHACWCGAAFNRLYNLRRHMRLVHGNDEALPPVRRVEVLDSKQSVKQPICSPPAKKMIVKSRKVKADCLKEEQEAAAAAVVVVAGGDNDERNEMVVSSGQNDGLMGNSGMEILSQVAMSLHDPSSQQQLAMGSVGGYASMAAAAVRRAVGQSQNISHHTMPHPLPHAHLAMDSNYPMVTATLHHQHETQLVSSTLNTDATHIPAIPHQHLASHHALDYSQLQGLPTMVPYTTSAATTTNVSTTTTIVDATIQRHDYYGPGNTGMDGLQQPVTVGGDYSNPYSMIQNFLLPSVGVSSLLDLAHASGSK